MATKTEFVSALLTCCDKVYVANQSPNKPKYPLLLYEQTGEAPAVFADNKPWLNRVSFWVYFYDTQSVTALEASVDTALEALGYSGRLVRASTQGKIISKIKEYRSIEEVE